MTQFRHSPEEAETQSRQNDEAAAAATQNKAQPSTALAAAFVSDSLSDTPGVVPALPYQTQEQSDVPGTAFFVVYLQQIKKKARAEGKTCHAKTMLSLERPIKLL